jgi:hypothetical protein
MWRFLWLFPLFFCLLFFNQLQQNPGDLLLCDLLSSAVCVSLDSEKKAAGACSVGAEMMACDVMHMWCCDADDKMRKDKPWERAKGL